MGASHPSRHRHDRSACDQMVWWYWHSLKHDKQSPQEYEIGNDLYENAHLGASSMW